MLGRARHMGRPRTEQTACNLLQDQIPGAQCLFRNKVGGIQRHACMKTGQRVHAIDCCGGIDREARNPTSCTAMSKPRLLVHYTAAMRSSAVTRLLQAVPRKKAPETKRREHAHTGCLLIGTPPKGKLQPATHACLPASNMRRASKQFEGMTPGAQDGACDHTPVCAGHHNKLAGGVPLGARESG